MFVNHVVVSEIHEAGHPVRALFSAFLFPVISNNVRNLFLLPVIPNEVRNLLLTLSS